MATQRFAIRFDRLYAVLSSALLLLPSDSYLELDGEQIHVRMGWGFRATFPRATVARAAEFAGMPLSRGVHGFAGRWLVNGAGRGLVTLDLEPAQRARVMGVPVRLSQLMVSVDDPIALTRALGR